MSNVLDPSLRPVAEALVDALVPATDALPDRAAAAGFWEVFGRLWAAWPGAERVRAQLLIQAAGRLASRQGGADFPTLPAERRTEVVAAWVTSRFPPIRGFATALSRLLLPAYFGTERVRGSLGDRTHEKPAVEDPPLPQVVHGSPEIDLEADVVVIGSGAGGSPLAAELAWAGQRVVVVEAGTLIPPSALAPLALHARAQLTWDGGTHQSIGTPTLNLLSGRTVGGTTAMGHGVLRRTPDPWLERWSAGGLGPAWAPAAMAPLFERIEERLAVRPTPHALAGSFQESLHRTLGGLGWAHEMAPRHASGCEGSHRCAVGCPASTIVGTARSYLLWAAARGAIIVGGRPVERVVFDDRGAAGVLLLGGGRIRARRVVVTAGALRTPDLLWASGIRHGGIGNKLSLHPQATIRALVPGQNTAAPPATPCGLLVDAFQERGLLLHGAWEPPDLASESFAARPPAERAETMGHHKEIGALSVLLADRPSGTLDRWQRGRPLVRYDLHPADAASIVHGIERGCELLLTAGAKRLFLPVPRLPPLEWWEDPAERLRVEGIGPGDLALRAYAATGSCPAGADPAIHPVDAELRLRDVDGLYVCDASVLPTSVPVPPALTIMALAVRLADAIRGG